MKNEYPILIPIKEQSIRCPNKNIKLLPFTLNYLKKIEMLDKVVVISDSYNLIEYAKPFGVTTYFEVREKGQDELLSCYNYLKNNIKSDYFFLLPVTHPIRQEDLLLQFEKKIQKVEVDFLTSVCKISDRRIFFVDIQEGERTKFLYENLERRGQNCEQCYMIDGSVYLIKMDFLKKVIHSKNTNKTFWDGNFQHIINDSPFLDIDTLQDMNKFEYIRDHFI